MSASHSWRSRPKQTWFHVRVLITGGNGFIGSHLADTMLRKSHSVVLMDQTFGSNTANLSCEKITGDVSDLNSFRDLPKNFDLIFHAAAVSRVEWGETDPEKCLRTNVIGTLNAVIWATGQPTPPHLVLASSREVYGNPKSVPVTEEDPRNPVSIYGISKATAEDLIKHSAMTRSLKYTIVRLANVYGSTHDQPGRVIPIFVHKAMRNEPLILNGGEQVLDFIHYQDIIDDLIRIFELADGPTCRNTTLNLATGQGNSIHQLAVLIRRLTNSNSTISTIPRREYDVKQFIGDDSKAQDILHHHSRTNLEKGLERYIAQVRQEKH